MTSTAILTLRNQDRNCGPTAVARITGWHVDRVVMHIRALRERDGRRLSLRGGTQPTEYMDALRIAGWVCDPDPIYIRLSELGTNLPTAWWLCHQPRHVFAFKRRLDYHWFPRSAKVWVTANRVRRITDRLRPGPQG